MRKSELNPAQRASHDTILSKLISAGWEPQKDQLDFEEGQPTLYDINMRRSNGRVTLRILREPSWNELYLAMDTRGGEGIGLYLQCGDRLPQVLDALVEMQDLIDETTYKLHVAHLVKTCPTIYAGTDDGRRVRLTDTKGISENLE